MNIVREMLQEDRALFCTLMDEFYHTEGVLHPIPREYYDRAAKEMLSGSPYAKAYLISSDGEAAGYGQISFTYSTEAGGMVLWFEELYIRPQYQGKGLGTLFFQEMFLEYRGKVARMRLEIEPENKRARALYERLGFRSLGYESMVIEGIGD